MSPKDPPQDSLPQDELAKLIAAAKEKAFVLYEGKQVPHRSCGIAIAETFGLPSRPYQALRKGGITGEGECGAIKAGELVLGELLGDPDPTGKVTPALRRAAIAYRERWPGRLALVPDGAEAQAGGDGVRPNIVCNHLTAPFEDFMGQGRQRFCTCLAAGVAGLVAEILAEEGEAPEIEPISDVLDAE